MILGHKKQWEYLQKMKESQKMPHALLFCGEAQLGKKTLAIEFLKQSFGWDLFSHPDFIFLEPLQAASTKVPASQGEIQISQIRNLNWKLSLKPFSAPFKAAIIDKAHLMNQEAQNCFLKTLEEPKGDTFIILISEHPNLLLPTIISRVQKIKFFPVEKKEIEKYLSSRNVPEKEINLLSELAQGRPGAAIDFLLNPEKLADFKKRIKEVTILLESDLGKRLQYAKDLSQKEDMADVLNIWLDLFRNILMAGLGLQKKWVILRKEYSLEKIKTILKNIQTTIFLTSTTNVSKKLALELLLIEL